jgi:uncharacterized membrane protein
LVIFLRVENKKGQRPLSLVTLAILFLIIGVSVVGGIISLVDPRFVYVLLPGGTDYVLGGAIYEAVYVILTLATAALYLFGGAIIAYGAILIVVRFVQCKLKDPYQPSLSTRYLSGYLTLGLEIFIGAEIIRTVVVRTPSEFALLILVIVSRGLFSLILYLERRWRGTEESE